MRRRDIELEEAGSERRWPSRQKEHADDVSPARAAKTAQRSGRSVWGMLAQHGESPKIELPLDQGKLATHRFKSHRKQGAGTRAEGLSTTGKLKRVERVRTCLERGVRAALTSVIGVVAAGGVERGLLAVREKGADGVVVERR
jgi:hypothetical protein